MAWLVGVVPLRLPLTVVFAATLLVQSSARATPVTDDSEQANADLLGAWLDAQAIPQLKERRFTGGSVLSVGAAGLGFGLALLIKPPNNELSKGGGVALAAAGAFGVGLGIFRLIVESESEKVDRRYRALSEDERDAEQVARFEGELYAASRHAQRVQQLARWLGLATTLAGVAVLVATPFADLSSGGQVAAYVSGGLLVLGGGVNFGSSFGTPPPIKAWEAYQQGLRPNGRSGALFGLVPMLGRGRAGVGLVVVTGQGNRMRARPWRRL